MKTVLESCVVIGKVETNLRLIQRSIICFSIYSYAESVGAKHFETSAKNNVGVEELFLELTNMVNFSRLKFNLKLAKYFLFAQMIAAHDAKQTENTNSRTNSLRRSNRLVVADSSDMEDTSSSRCCGNG